MTQTAGKKEERYALALKDKATGKMGGWYQLTPPNGAKWIHEPFSADEKPSQLSLERISEIMSQMDLEDHTLWVVADSQNRTMILPNQYKEELEEPMTQTADQRKDQRKRKFRVWKGKEKQTGTDKPQQQKEQQEEGSGWSPLLLCICVLLGLLLALAIAWNVQPFQDFIKLLANRIDFTDFSDFLFALPGIGGLFLWIAEFFAAALGILLYAIFQGLELAPYLYKRNPKRMKRIIEQWSSWATYRLRRNDDRAVRSIKRSYNNHPIRTYQTLCTTRNLVYVLELAICFVTHPPVTDGNLFTFLWYLVTFQVGKIDWINVLLMFSVLFLVDRIVRIILSIYPEIFPDKKEEATHA